MVPSVAVPNVQVAPPVETSLFSGQISDPKLGRLPFKTVPAAIDGSKVSDQPRQQQQASSKTSTTETAATAAASAKSSASGLTPSLSAEPKLSTPFAAQLFAQLQTSAGLVSGMGGGGTGIPSGFVDFDRLAEFGKVKYKPSNAFAPRVKPEQQQAIEEFSQSIEASRAKVEAAMQEVSARAAASETQTQPTPIVAPVAVATVDAPEQVEESEFDTNDYQRRSAPQQQEVETPDNAESDTPQSQLSFQALVDSVTNAYKATQSRVSETLGAESRSGSTGSVSLVL